MYHSLSLLHWSLSSAAARTSFQVSSLYSLTHYYLPPPPHRYCTVLTLLKHEEISYHSPIPSCCENRSSFACLFALALHLSCLLSEKLVASTNLLSQYSRSFESLNEVDSLPLDWSFCIDSIQYLQRTHIVGQQVMSVSESIGREKLTHFWVGSQMK